MAGIFERMSMILRANINDLLDRAEDPEKMLDQIIRDMESAILDARQQVQDMLAQQKLLEAEVRDTQKLVDEWQRKAEMAVAQNRDDLAREALKRKNDYQSQLQVYQSQLVDQEALVAKLRTELSELESKYDSAKRNKDVLIARQRAARAKEEMAKKSAQIQQIPDYSSDFGRMEQRVREQEARAAAASEMNDQATSMDRDFASLEDPAIEDELAAMKAKMGKTAPTPPADAPTPPTNAPTAG